MTHVKISLAGIFSIILLASCAEKNVVLLLPGPDGKSGAILVSNRFGKQVLTEPNQATAIASVSDAPAPPYTMSDEKIRELYGEALSALPLSPVHFVLYFRSGTAQLTQESNKPLDELLLTAKERKSTDISVVGHTDRVGSREANYRLGMERTDLVRQLLLNQGVGGDFIDTSSHGEDNPLIKTDDEVPEPRNRRVEVVVR